MSSQRKIEGKVIISSLYTWRRPKVLLQLISSVNGDPSKEFEGKVGMEAYLDSKKSEIEGENTVFKVSFDWDEEIGIPGAFYVTNNHKTTSFFLNSFTLMHVPAVGNIHFDCNSWIYPYHLTVDRRIFFANKAYLPHETPKPLQKYRDNELMKLRGDGQGERKIWDRIYDYDVYNDVSNLKSNSTIRPILGGIQYPYPRRGRTGRPLIFEGDQRYESRCSNIYVPSDERFGDLKQYQFTKHQLKSMAQSVRKGLQVFLGRHPTQFDSFQDVFTLYERHRPFPRLKLPQVIQTNQFAWKTDEEFAREMLAGANPTILCRLQEFPPSSKLDPNVYGDQNSKISKEHIINSLNGLTVDEAIKQNKLYILDHHDSLIPFLRKINTTPTKTYATRTLLFLKDDGTLKPLAIELSLPHPQGDEYGTISRVLLPAQQGVHESLWQLAKAYVRVNDSGHHQLVSHWLNTHAVIEPFVIATNRQLSVVHPIHKLLIPHFRYTMNINALARGILINANGIVEKTQYPSKYSMEMSSFAYQNWVFPQQALPADLIMRGVAIEDSSSPHGLRLLIEDYPYAVDGLEIWTAIKTWVTDYCSFYYEHDKAIQNDTELESWWKEVREKGHEDKKNEPWWPKMASLEELINSCTIIIWISSALHAAVNFGQYPYGGFFPNRPTTSKRFLPEEGTYDYRELESSFETAFLKTFTSQLQKDDILGISTIELLSTHSPDEIYLGQRSNPEWTFDKQPLAAFDRFGRKLAEIEQIIAKRNQDPMLRNRVGAVNIPYTLLFPTSQEGLTCRGIPNSISI